MKKLGFLVIMFLGLFISFTSDIPELLQKEIQSISGMNKTEFNNFLNKKHYLIKSWAIDPHGMNPQTYKALYETLNYQATILDKIKNIID